MFSASCSMSVDLPMPGSPPIRVTDPVTNPPPSTRSSSWSPVAIRFSVEDTMVPTGLGVLERWVAELVFQEGTFVVVLSTTSSTNVFHSLQEGHLPSHFADSYPQFWQKYADFDLAN